MLKLLSPSDARRLREFLVEAEFTHETFRGKLNFGELPSRQQRTIPRLLRATEEPTTLNTLFRLFFVGSPVEARAAAALIPDWALALFLESGLLRGEGETLASTVMLAPCEQFLIASDHPLEVESRRQPDLVIWPNPTTGLLIRFTVRRPSRATLDLGAGCGAQAIAAVSHSERVTATDLNPRATEFCAFNARLNAADSIECLTGDAFAPVEGRTFDLIVSNPPFFITPSKRYLYCDNPMDLDGFCRRLVREAPRFLNEDGFLQMVFEWAELQGQPWQERLAEWFDGTGCDAWVLRDCSADPLKYALERMRQTTPYSPDTDAALYSEWTSYYREEGVVMIHAGTLTLRRRSGRNWVRIDDTPREPTQPFGDAILQGFAARDFLDSHSDEELLASKPKLSPDAFLDERLRQSNGAWQPDSLNLRLASGLAFSIALQPLVAEFLAGCDGARPLGERVEELAGKANVPRDQVQRECLAVVRRLIERGFVLW